MAAKLNRLEKLRVNPVFPLDFFEFIHRELQIESSVIVMETWAIGGDWISGGNPTEWERLSRLRLP